MRAEIAPELLRTLLRYDAETGYLYWRERDPSLFEDTPARSRSRNAAWWNGRFSGKRACKSDSHKGYLRVGIFGDEYPAHRVIWAMEHGVWPTNTIDHIDGDKAHNILRNLREATTSENNRNRAPHGKSQFRGVSWRSRQSRWIAAIATDGKVTFLGSFDTEEDAARAYDAAAIIQHGEFARLNFPQSDYEARIRSALVPPAVPGEVEPLKWHVGWPPHPWDKEWFIAETTYGDRVVLIALPEEYTYDFKTADDTYIKAEKIKRWMQFPDSHYLPHQPAVLSVPLPEIEEGDGWQPIETAPIDGTDILVCVTYNLFDDEWETMQWVDWQVPAIVWPVFRDRIDIPFPPTHWRPLPAAPSASIEGETDV